MNKYDWILEEVKQIKLRNTLYLEGLEEIAKELEEEADKEEMLIDDDGGWDVGE